MTRGQQGDIEKYVFVTDRKSGTFRTIAQTELCMQLNELFILTRSPSNLKNARIKIDAASHSPWLQIFEFHILSMLSSSSN